MAKCIYCHERKGKRPCPALGGAICSACCGEYRGTVISCPQDCIYLVNHEGYQRERIGHHFSLERLKSAEALHQKWGRDAVGFLNLLDMATYAYFQGGRPTVQDHEILLGLESLRRRLSPLQIPGVTFSTFGEFLWKEVEEYLRETPSINDLAAPVVEEAVLFLKAFSGDKAVSTRYLRGLMGFIESHYPDVVAHLKQSNLAPGRRIITLEDELALKRQRGVGRAKNDS